MNSTNKNNPLTNLVMAAKLTDLCGGRAIVHTARQVEQICNCIKGACDIDWATCS